MKCWCCKQDKPKSEFHKDKRRKSGIASSCKTCTRERNVKFMKTHITVAVPREHVEKVREFIKSLQKTEPLRENQS